MQHWVALRIGKALAAIFLLGVLALPAQQITDEAAIPLSPDGLQAFPVRPEPPPQPQANAPFAPAPAPWTDPAVGQTIHAQQWQQLVEALKAEAQARQLPAVALTVIQGDEVRLTLTLGLADSQRGEPVTASTLFNLGPCTQGLTSLLAVHLEQEQFLRLDDPVALWQPDFHLSDRAASQRTTLRHLLSMTAGIPNYTDQILDPTWALPEDVFAALAQAPVMAMPGRLVQQSQLSIAAAGYLMGQRIGESGNLGRDFRWAMRERILIPLGMTSATFSPQEAQNLGGAKAYEATESGYRPARQWETENNPFAPVLGLKASLADVTQWMLVELNEGQLASGQQLASANRMRARWRGIELPQPGRQTRVGMGWLRDHQRGLNIYYLAGSYDRHSACVGLIPTAELAFGILTNAGDERALGYLERVRSLLLEAVAGNTAPVAQSPLREVD